MNTSSKVALVTGSATGAGRACAVRFAKLGYAVAVNYSKSEADALETVAMVKACGVPGFLCKATVGDDAQVRHGRSGKAGARRARRVVNNAGTTHFIDHTNLDALTDAVWDEIFQVNLKPCLLHPGGDAAATGGERKCG